MTKDEVLASLVFDAREVLVLGKLGGSDDSVAKLADKLMERALKEFPEEFPEEEVVVAALKKLKADKAANVHILNTEYLSTVNNSLIPMFIIKDIMNDEHQIKLNLPECSSWKLFMDKYRSILSKRMQNAAYY